MPCFRRPSHNYACYRKGYTYILYVIIAVHNEIMLSYIIAFLHASLRVFCICVPTISTNVVYQKVGISSLFGRSVYGKHYTLIALPDHGAHVHTLNSKIHSIIRFHNREIILVIVTNIIVSCILGHYH